MRVFKSTYRDRGGKKCKTSKWYVETRDHLELVRRFPAFPGKKESEAFGRQIDKLVVCKMSSDPLSIELMRWLENIPSKMRERFVKIGLLDPSRAASGKPLVQHVEDFRESMKAKSITNLQVNIVTSRVERIVKGCKFHHWSNISTTKIERYLADLRQQGLGKETSNKYVKAIRQFAKWMIDNERATTSPVAHLKTIKVTRDDRRRLRRPLEADEVRRLLEATRAAGTRFGLSGHQRALLYRLACESGLRANELRMLKVGSFDFDNCEVIVQDHTAKNRKEKTLPLRPDTAAEIKELLANMLPGTQAFKVPGKPIDMLRPDLEAAGIEYQDDAGRYCDFHSLRHTTASLLAASGVHPKTAMEILRHSDINLTLSHYTHSLRGQEAEAVSNLPDLGAPSTEGQRAMKTGTDNRNVTDSVLASCLALSGAEHSPTVTSGEKANPPAAIKNRIPDYPREDSNLQPLAPEANALSN